MALPQGPYYQSLGELVRSARAKCGLTQEALAREVGLTRTSITNIEKGRQPLPVHMLAKIAHAVRTDATHLLPSASLLDQELDARLEYLDEAQRDWVARIVAKPKEKTS